VQALFAFNHLLCIFFVRGKPHFRAVFVFVYTIFTRIIEISVKIFSPPARHDNPQAPFLPPQNKKSPAEAGDKVTAGAGRLVWCGRTAHDLDLFLRLKQFLIFYDFYKTP